MPSRKEIAAMGPVERELYETAREERAARQRRRTGWRTDATEKEKETALRLAINQLGGGKKYSWLQQVCSSLACVTVSEQPPSCPITSQPSPPHETNFFSNNQSMKLTLSPQHPGPRDRSRNTWPTARERARHQERQARQGA
ncbi:hypothetical protein F4823DRAFT_572536 [Ustulina deusta]|nr:hypothetical protein F4823DRAFT_572536 [Ustulina deusta]